MLLPYSTDAPLYHWPAATVTLIVLNVFAFVISTASVISEAANLESDESAEEFQIDPEELERLKKMFPDEDEEGLDEPEPAMPAEGDPADEDDGLAQAIPMGFVPMFAQRELDMTPEEYEKNLPTIYRRFGVVYARGLKPWQWFTALFLHGNFSHLVGNMLFLWSFGLVVEGKIGWWRFLLVYFGIGGAVNFLQQAMSFWFTLGVSFGASGAIFGLMAMCLVWAPMNEMSVILWIAYRAIQFEMLIWKLAVFYIAINGAIVFLTGYMVSSELLHMMGAMFGFPLGILFLKFNWVDCEGWDMFRVMSNTHGASQELMSRYRPDARKMKWSEGKEAEQEGAKEPSGSGKKSGPNRLQVRNKLVRLIKSGDAEAALPEYQMLKKLRGVLEEADHLKLIEVFLNAKETEGAIRVMEDYLEMYESQATAVRFKLAKTLLVEERPKAAVNVLKPLKAAELPKALADRRLAYLKKARELMENGTVEVDG